MVVVDGIAEYEEEDKVVVVTINVVVSGAAAEVAENDKVLVRTDVADDRVVVVETEDEVDHTIEID